MSHSLCLAEMEPQTDSVAAQSDPASASEEQGRYDCVNECMSGLGLPMAVAGAAVTVGCVIVSAGACGILAGGVLGAFVGACDAQCDERQESRS